ncbi:MAG TPA: hypothetical protein DEB40_13545 [Elusimicrobia bacterium]|nr:hypothetical protein [Elusimicrobiota bacterium]HBT62758.1 hypothetical protein [Elusimicrobiota bacterium]
MTTERRAAQSVLRLEQAKDFMDQGRPGDALPLLRRPVPEMFAPERDFLLAEALRAQGFLSQAVETYRRLLRRPAKKDPAAWLDACLGNVACLRSLGETKAARRMLSLGRKVAASLRNQAIQERLDLEDALIERAMGLYPKSLAKFKSQLIRFLREEDLAAAGYVLWAIGGALRFSGDFSGSQRAFAQSLALCRRCNDPAGRAYALFGLGGVTRVQGRLAEAQRHYAAALKAVSGTQDIFGQAYAHCGLANVLRQRGELSAAKKHYIQAHRLYSLIEDPVDLAYVDWGLGRIHLRRGELAPAQKRFELALTAFARGGETRGVVLCETSLAGLLHSKGLTFAAERLFARALARARRAGIHTHLELFT